MIFNSIEFSIFLPIVFLLYWFVTNRNIKLQNSLLVVASYTFYGWWDWRFLSLILFSSLIDYSIGRALGKTPGQKNRKLLLFASIVVNIGLLGYFKYFNFFVESFNNAFTLFGKSFDIATLKIVLPVGISFYTFQTLSYTIDVYRQKLEPTKDFVAFFAFVSFFPQLVAGPIERATNLLPQFYKKRIFDYNHAADGVRQALWGLFKKIVIADNCAEYVNLIFANYDSYSGSTLLIAGVFFTIQIYADFSGYSDIAIGISRLFGFNLKQNFAYPFFSRNLAEFWRRWHISLTTWFRDYVYIPIGGSKGGLLRKIRNVFVIFLISGFWHGANATFIVWGAANAIFFLPSLLRGKNRKYMNPNLASKFIPKIIEIFQILMTFIIASLLFIIFRSVDVSSAFYFIGNIFSSSLFASPFMPKFNVLFWIALMLVMEWFQKNKLHALQFGFLQNHRIYRWTTYFVLISIIFCFGGGRQEFIYFQF